MFLSIRSGRNDHSLMYISAVGGLVLAIVSAIDLSTSTSNETSIETYCVLSRSRVFRDFPVEQILRRYGK